MDALTPIWITVVSVGAVNLLAIAFSYGKLMAKVEAMRVEIQHEREERIRDVKRLERRPQDAG